MNRKQIVGGINYKNPKGFTLIELLAVIVILAAIALIVTPIITGVIETAKKGTAVSSAYGYIEAIENEISLAYLKNNLYEDKDDYAYDEIEVDVKGDKPTAGIYALEKSKVTTASFCISGYVVNYSDNEAKAGEKCNPDDLKYNGSVKLSSSFGRYIYPETGTVEIIENISGGNLSCSSSDEEIATCSIEETTVNIISGTKEGTATITVTSEATNRYKEAKAAYVVSTEEGILSVTASDKTVTYDGNAYGIEVTSSGATIKYGTASGTYDLETSPTRTNAGTTKVYYQVTKTGYKTVTGSKDIVISKASGGANLSVSSVIVKKKATVSVSITSNTGSIGTPTSDNTNVATASLNQSTVVITGVNEGTAKITIPINESTNYNATSKTISVSNTCSYESGYTWNFDYTGSEQSFTVPCDGMYKLETWGAQGDFYGGVGFGSYSVGQINLNKNNKLYVTVGQRGQYVGVGGYNGGGQGSNNNDNTYGYSVGGGGATHIAYVSGTLASIGYNSFVTQGNGIMVAGGGGGHSGWQNNGYGGHAGGYVGNSGLYNNYAGGGSQTAGGFGNGATSGTFGAGGYQTNSGCSTAGGGGGLYGGGAACNGGGGGGSGYIGNPNLSTKSMYCYDCQTSNEESTKTVSTTCTNSTAIENCSKQGNGYARIAFIG